MLNTERQVLEAHLARSRGRIATLSGELLEGDATRAGVADLTAERPVEALSAAFIGGALVPPRAPARTGGSLIAALRALGLPRLLGVLRPAAEAAGEPR